MDLGRAGGGGEYDQTINKNNILKMFPLLKEYALLKQIAIFQLLVFILSKNDMVMGSLQCNLLKT